MTTPKLDPATITPESIVEAAKRHGLRLMPEGFLHGPKRKPIGCCAMAALAIDLDPTLLTRGQGFAETLLDRGLTLSYGYGLTMGFDGRTVDTYSESSHPEFIAGFEMGRAVRRLAGLDLNPPKDLAS